MPSVVKGAVGVLVSTGLGLILGGPAAGAVCLAVALMLVAAWYWRPLRDWLGLQPHEDEAPTPQERERIGYRGRPGSYGNLAGSRFGEGLDVGIDSEGDVDAPGSDFGARSEEDEDSEGE